MSGSYGPQSRISMAAAGTAIASYTEAIEFESESLRKQNSIVDTNGISGTRSHHSERTRFGLDVISGMITLPCSPLLLDLLLPRIGFSNSGNTWSLTETTPYFDILIDRIAKRYVYGNCKVNSVKFKMTPGQIVTMELDIRGQSETVAATSFPSIATPLDYPYVMSDMAGTLVGTARTIMSLEIMIDNALNVRNSNSNTATDITSTDRIVTVTATTPFTSSETDLYGQALLGSAGSIVLTNGGCSCTFSFATIQFPDSSPVVSSRNGEIVLEVTGQARMSSTTKELIITNDSSP